MASAIAALSAAPATAPIPSEVDEANRVSTSDRRTSSATDRSVPPIWRSLATMLVKHLPPARLLAKLLYLGLRVGEGSDGVYFAVIASGAKQSSLGTATRSPLDCFVAAANRQFILSDAAGGSKGSSQ